MAGTPDGCSVLARDPQTVIGRNVIHHNDFIAWPQALECPPEAETVVVGMHDGSDGWHNESAMKPYPRGTRNQ